jgi:hypothetical protein
MLSFNFVFKQPFLRIINTRNCRGQQFGHFRRCEDRVDVTPNGDVHGGRGPCNLRLKQGSLTEGEGSVRLTLY